MLPCVTPPEALRNAATRLLENGVRLPRFAQLASPLSIPKEIVSALEGVDPNAADPLNLWRIHWHNAKDSRGFVEVPDHVVLPGSLTGVEAPIVVMLGDRFPMIGAHKVLAAYACLATRLAGGQFDPTRNKAIWPSTGNYARGGVAISRILGCRGVAVLPEGMSRERFQWLEAWVSDPSDIIRTPGSESNVKEIYDACARLAEDPENVILNQFSEMPNHVAHFHVTGPALARVFEHLRQSNARARLAGFVSASGSAGTLGAGDYLKERYGSLSMVVEALECPTLLENGYGEHNIQGIGDKHVPLIHNVMGTDVVAAVSDRATDALDAIFASQKGRDLLVRRGVPEQVIESLSAFGLSSIANMLGAIKLARRLRLGPNDYLVTVATDGARMYAEERPERVASLLGGEPEELGYARLAGQFLDAVSDDHLLELTSIDRRRIFNLGYFTWVEQQGVSLADFEARRDLSWWEGQRAQVKTWDEEISALNEQVEELARLA